MATATSRKKSAASRPPSPRKPGLSLVPPSPAAPALSLGQPSLKVQLLVAAQRGSSILAAVAVFFTLATYGWSVYLPKRWSQEFQKLEALQSYERQLVAMDETLKHQLASLATQPNRGLVPPHPSQPFFVAQPKKNTASHPNAVQGLPEKPLPGDRLPVAY